MKRTFAHLLVFAVVLVLGVAPLAQAHNSHGWFWSVGLAEARYRAHYDVYAVSCDGIGQWIRSKPNAQGRRQRLYRHFDCFDTTTDGMNEEVILHVKGHYAFAVYSV